LFFLEYLDFPWDPTSLVFAMSNRAFSRERHEFNYSLSSNVEVDSEWIYGFAHKTYLDSVDTK
jgi:hypothetical protein